MNSAVSVKHFSKLDLTNLSNDEVRELVSIIEKANKAVLICNANYVHSTSRLVNAVRKKQ